MGGNAISQNSNCRSQIFTMIISVRTSFGYILTETLSNIFIQALDLEQGTQWLKERRLPAFMDGDFYFEYRLAKMLSQLQIAKRCKKVEMVELTLKDSILDEIRASNSRLETLINAKTEEKKHDNSEVSIDVKFNHTVFFQI